MKILMMLIIFPAVLWASDFKKNISSFKVLRPLSLTQNNNLENIQKGVYRIILQKTGEAISLWFEQLDKEFKFKLSSDSSIGETFSLSSKISGQPFNLVVYVTKDKNKSRTFEEELESACKIEGEVKNEEECHPKLKWVPFEYRKVAWKKGKMFCYRKPQLNVRWGKRKDKLSVTVWSRLSHIDLVEPRKNEIVASGHYRDEQMHKKLIKKGLCR